MMQTNYQIAFTLDVQHTYFDKGICKCLQFVPGAGTAKLMRRFEITMLKKVNGFDFYIDSPQTIAQYLDYITQATGQTCFDFNISATDQQFYLFTDTGKIGPGQLTFDTGAAANTVNNDVVDLYCYQSPSLNASFIGTLSIDFDDIISYARGESGAAFNISFRARATQWQYFIINRSAVKLDNPVIAGKADIGFEGPKSVVTSNGQPAIFFSSGTNLIPLSETPVYQFNLVNSSANGSSAQKINNGKIVFKGLPNPHPGIIALAGDGLTGQLASPMYVYV
ncbi:hypothetical protein [Mucilaginibacter celer]|uniref:Uncharacterized protein n=1 Tax=Mucilaginibacter celer TaxID=2305508 RepID=A0A494VZV5_9SPHI|nr:hypothetical protein [Mucilaginibacter celer]AYL99030.1 hypothetical protein HYN43_028820 [Mucilaginibacter celer]